MPRKRIDYQSGDLVGACEFIKYVAPHITPNGKNMHKALFVCPECGKEFVSIVANTKRGDVRSCGCIRTRLNKKMAIRNITHGMTKTPLHIMWTGIKQRCYNENNPSYFRYGARGITMYDRWINNPTSFIKYISNLPDFGNGLTLERKDNDKGYEPDNLEWATRHVQSANQRTPINNTSGFRGVGFNKSTGKWESEIMVNRKKHWLGTFPTIIEAANARNNYIIKNSLWEYPLQQTHVA